MVDFSKFFSEKISEKQNRKEIEITGIKTDCFTGKETCVKLTGFLTNGQHGKVFKIEGGPTGYESFCLDKNDIRSFRQEGYPWIACMGTEKRWDRLVVPYEEMIKAFDFLEVA